MPGPKNSSDISDERREQINDAAYTLIITSINAKVSLFHNQTLTQLQQKHMFYAAYGMKEVYKLLPLGGLNRVDVRDKLDGDELAEQYKFFRSYREALEKRYKDGFSESIKEKILGIRTQMKGGFCGEYAEIAVEKIIERYPEAKDKIEYVIFKESIHQLIVIGRNKDSTKKDISKWGDAAVILDPWAKKIYLASAFAKIRESNDVKYVTLDKNNHILADLPECHYLEGKPWLRAIYPIMTP